MFNNASPCFASSMKRPCRRREKRLPEASRLFGFQRRKENLNRFASWLPYISYEPVSRIFVNLDTIGFLSGSSTGGADQTMVDVLKSIFPSCPARTGVRFQLFTSPHVKDTLRQYANLRVEDDDQLERAKEWGRPARNSNVYRALARRRVEHTSTVPAQSGARLPLHDTGLPSAGQRQRKHRARSKIHERHLRDSISATLRAPIQCPARRGGFDQLVRCSPIRTGSFSVNRQSCATTTGGKFATRSSTRTRSRMPRHMASTSASWATKKSNWKSVSIRSSRFRRSTRCGKWAP